MLNVAVMRPLRFRTRFPLRKPSGLPSRLKSVEAEPESANTGKQFANSLFHKALLWLSCSQLAYIL